MIAMFLFLFTTIPERWWILLTVLVCSSGIEPGLVMRRSKQRIKGTLAALMIILPLIYCLRLNYRLIPVCFIVFFIALNVSALNTKRYDITVFFMTLMVFLLLAQTASDNRFNGSFEMVLNRGLCTLIGIAIVIFAEYFLFKSHRYSYKLYLFHQMTLYDFLQEKLTEVTRTQKEDINSFLFIERLRDQVIEHFSPIQVSAENLKLEKNTEPEIKKHVDLFQTTIWEIRRLLFALCFAKYVLDSPSVTSKHIAHFNELMNEAKANFIYCE